MERSSLPLWGEPVMRARAGLFMIKRGRLCGCLTFAFACLVAAGTCSAVEPPSTVTIRIEPGKRADHNIPRTIFGSFLEPIGNSTYNGLWAEILQNPSFEENLWSAAGVAQMVRQEPELAQASRLGLPLPWEPLKPSQGDRYEPRWGEAANSWRSLAVLGLPNDEVGVKQKVYLPVQREWQYRGSIYLKHLSGPEAVYLSLRSREQPAAKLAETTVSASSGDWQKYTFSLQVPAGKVRPLEAVDFAITVKGEERVLVDQASLMPADALDGLDPDMVAMAKAMHTPLVRFGGNFTSAYHWRDGVGPRDKRVSMLNISWGIPEYNQFGTDEFLHFCQLIGAQPQIALNLGSGTAQEAADWVRYVDQHWSEHRGLFWELGNELWGNWNLGYPTAQEIASRTLEFSKAVRGVDPAAKLIATGQDPDHFEQWNAAQLGNPAGTFDFLSTHFVVTTNRTAEEKNVNPNELAADTFALPVELGRKMRAMQTQIDGVPDFRNRAHIAFTEWLFICCDGAAVDAPRYDNMGGAIAAAGFFNMLLRNSDIVPISDMTGIMEFAGIWKKRGQVYGTPSYYAFQMYSGAQAEAAVQVEENSGTYDVHGGITRFPDIASVPYLDVVAAVDSSGKKLTIFCVNRHLSRDIPATVSLGNFTARSAHVMCLQSPESIYDGNDEMRPKHIAPVPSELTPKGGNLQYTFPHESVTRIEIQ